MKNGFYLFKWLRKIKRRLLSCGTWKLFDMKFYWNTGPHSFLYCLWLLSCKKWQSWVVVTEIIWFTSLKNIYLLFFTEKVCPPLTWGTGENVSGGTPWRCYSCSPHVTFRLVLWAGLYCFTGIQIPVHCKITGTMWTFHSLFLFLCSSISSV